MPFSFSQNAKFRFHEHFHMPNIFAKTAQAFPFSRKCNNEPFCSFQSYSPTSPPIPLSGSANTSSVFNSSLLSSSVLFLSIRLAEVLSLWAERGWGRSQLQRTKTSFGFPCLFLFHGTVWKVHSPESIEWFIENKAFLPSYNFALLPPPPPFPVGNLSLFLSLPVCRRLSFERRLREGVERSQLRRWRESLVLYELFNTLWHILFAKLTRAFSVYQKSTTANILSRNYLKLSQTE